MTRPTIHAFCVLALLLPSTYGAVVRHYNFDADLTDSSGNGQHGTLTDVGTVGNSLITTTAGTYKFGGGAMDFSDDRDYVAVPSLTFGSTLDYTISFWAQKDDAARDWNMVLGQRDVTTFFIAPRGSANNFLRWRSSDSSAARQQDFSVTSDTDWHHYAIVASGTTISLYLDGGLVSSGTGKQTGFIVDTIGDAYVAANDFDFQGRIDEVWILDEAADSTTISNLYAFNSTVPEPSSSLFFGFAGLLFILRRKR